MCMSMQMINSIILIVLHVMNPVVEPSLIELDFELGTIHTWKGVMSERFGSNNHTLQNN